MMSFIPECLDSYHISYQDSIISILEDSPKAINLCQGKVLHYSKTPKNQKQRSKTCPTNQKHCLPLLIS